MDTFLLWTERVEGVLPDPASWRCRNSTEMTNFPAPMRKITWPRTTGCFGGSRRCSVNPDVFTSKETQVRGLLPKGEAGKREPGHQGAPREETIPPCDVMGLPSDLTARTEPGRCGWSKGQALQGGWFGRALAMDARIHMENASFKR